jgi:hypothetical protein
MMYDYVCKGFFVPYSPQLPVLHCAYTPVDNIPETNQIDNLLIAC